MIQHPPCAAFSAVIRDHLRELNQFRLEGHYRRGDVIFSAEDPPDEIYTIETGRVELVCVSPEGRQKTMAIYQAGEFFGELCICGGARKREDRALALEPTHTVSFKVQAVLDLLRSKPELALELLALVCVRLAESQEQIATLAFDPIPHRLAKELLRLAPCLGSRVDENAPELALSLTHEELAKFVGTSREVITTVMSQFRRQGMLDYGRRNITFSPSRLEEYLRGDRVQDSAALPPASPAH